MNQIHELFAKLNIPIDQITSTISQHPAYLIPAVIVIGFIANAIFSALRTGIMIAAVIVVSMLLAGADFSGVMKNIGLNQNEIAEIQNGVKRGVDGVKKGYDSIKKMSPANQ